MSNARRKSAQDRIKAYLAQTGALKLTPAQRRRVAHKNTRPDR